MKLSKRMLALCGVVSTDREALKNIKFDCNKMYATDAFMMLVMPSEDGYDEGEKYEGYIDAQAVKGALAGISKLEAVYIQKKDDKVALVSTSGQETIVTPYTGNYPSLENVIPTTVPTTTVKVDISRLIELLQAMKKTIKVSKNITIEVRGVDKPVVIRTNDDVVGVIMPCR